MLLIQANRVCLGDLTGVDFPGEKHPKACPCDIARQKERLDQVVGFALVVVQQLVDQERAERRREEEKRREKEKEEEKREEQRRTVESKIEGKKRQFYRLTKRSTWGWLGSCMNEFLMVHILGRCRLDNQMPRQAFKKQRMLKRS